MKIMADFWPYSPHDFPPQTPLSCTDPGVTSPHFPPHQNQNQNHSYDQITQPGLDNTNWNRHQPSEIPYLQNCCYSHQNQNHFDSHQRNDLGDTHHLPYNTHTLLSDVYIQADTPAFGQNKWGPLDSTAAQIQCPSLGMVSEEVPLERWSSVDYTSSSPAYYSHENYNSQPFCSPNTPGPSPHYPQTPALCSPPPNTQTPGYESYAMSHSELIQDLTGFFSPHGRGQNVSDAPQGPGLIPGMNSREEEGGEPDWTWVKQQQQQQPENSTKVLESRLMCTVCNRGFRSLPALNGHMRSHSGFRSASWLNKVEDSSTSSSFSSLVKPSVSVVTPVSVPVQSKASIKPSRAGHRKCSRPSPATGGAALLYRSLMRLGQEEELSKTHGSASDGDGDVTDDVIQEVAVGHFGSGGSAHYTPPAMLCPVRSAPGLFCSLATGEQQRAHTVQLHNGLNDLVAVEIETPPLGTLTTTINKPRINIGRGFQAQVPPLRKWKHTNSNSHDALLLWTPWAELESPVNQQRVEALLLMSRCSVVKGGGANPDSVLSSLSESRGDFLRTVEKLLSPETSNSQQTHRPGEIWSAAEQKLFVKSLKFHHKDFNKIQKTVQTKSLAQCVEFYYQWKKRKTPSVKTPSALTQTNGRKSSRSHDAS